MGAAEHLRRELEVEASLAQIAVALPSIPPKAHQLSIRLYIRSRKGTAGLTVAMSRAAQCCPGGAGSIAGSVTAGPAEPHIAQQPERSVIGLEGMRRSPSWESIRCALPYQK